MTPRNMGPRIKALRKKRKLTQAQLAKAIGVGLIHVARMESADSAKSHRQPSLPTLEKLAKALNVSVGKLLK
jgi:transcriptional regulator with XRE-family HTH domain